jgi:hypothetical protein
MNSYFNFHSGGNSMTTISREITLLAARISPKTRMILFVASLAMFVIGAGAPEASGGIGH